MRDSRHNYLIMLCAHVIPILTSQCVGLSDIILFRPLHVLWKGLLTKTTIVKAKGLHLSNQ